MPSLPSITPPTHALAITLGDAAGIGPDIVLEALHTQSPEPHEIWHVWGDLTALADRAKTLGCQALLAQAQQHPQITWTQTAQPNMPAPIRDGAASASALHAACKWLLEQQAQERACILLTGPVQKTNLHAAGYPVGGQTELLAEGFEQLTGKHYHPNMLFDCLSPSGMLPWQNHTYHHSLRMLLLTRHVPLTDIKKGLTPVQIAVAMQQVVTYLKQVHHIGAPHLDVLGVNPHAGEIGGDEEETLLRPAIALLQKSDPLITIRGPFAADGYFRDWATQAITPPDAVVASYHDQGLIPVKLIHGFEAVNVTLGLPCLRVSVSHGTANALSGSGQANPAGWLSALRLARHCLTARQPHTALLQKQDTSNGLPQTAKRLARELITTLNTPPETIEPTLPESPVNPTEIQLTSRFKRIKRQLR